MYRFYGIFLGAIEVHSGTFSAEGTANVTCKIGLSTLSEICGSCSLFIHTIVVPWISRVYWICTTEGSCMYSPRAQPDGIHTTARGSTIIIHLQISTVQVAQLYYEHVLIRSN